MKHFISIIALFAANTLNAQDLEGCAAIQNDLDRLACYDKALGLTPEVSTEPSKGNWTVRQEKSEFKDTTDVFLSVSSEETVRCGYSGDQKITLFARCVENTTALIIATHCHVASGFQGYGSVEYRIDDKPTQKRGFNESTNNRSLGLWSGGQSIPVIKSLFGADSLLVRFTPFNENPVTAKFDVRGIEDAISPLRKSCGW